MGSPGQILGDPKSRHAKPLCSTLGFFGGRSWGKSCGGLGVVRGSRGSWEVRGGILGCPGGSTSRSARPQFWHVEVLGSLGVRLRESWGLGPAGSGGDLGASWGGGPGGDPGEVLGPQISTCATAVFAGQDFETSWMVMGESSGDPWGPRESLEVRGRLGAPNLEMQSCSFACRNFSGGVLRDSLDSLWGAGGIVGAPGEVLKAPSLDMPNNCFSRWHFGRVLGGP